MENISFPVVRHRHGLNNDNDLPSQSAFSAVQVLVCVSTIVDVASHRQNPTPFGTQHIALLLAAWGPAIVFSKCDHLPLRPVKTLDCLGHHPHVRQRLAFWRTNPSS